MSVENPNKYPDYRIFPRIDPEKPVDEIKAEVVAWDDCPIKLTKDFDLIIKVKVSSLESIDRHQLVPAWQTHSLLWHQKLTGIN